MEKIEIPFDKVEQILLKKFYTDSDYFNLIKDSFDKRFFSNESTALLLSLGISFFNKYSKLPSEEVLNLLVRKMFEKDESSYKKTITELKIAKEIDLSKDEIFIRESILSFIKRKGLYFAIMDNFTDIEKNQDVSKCIDTFQKISALGFDNKLGFDYFKDLDSHLIEVSNPLAKIPTGFHALDKILNGGFPRNGNCLAVFMAPPFMGKSLMLSNLAVNYLEQGLFPLIISLEMSELVYGTRIDAHISGEGVNSLHFNIDKVKSKIRNFESLHKEAQLFIKEYPTYSVTCNHIKILIEKVSERFSRKPDVILIDYINLLRSSSSSKNGNMYEKVGDITRELRGLSSYFKAPLVTATQTVRSGIGNTDIGMEHTSESIAVPQVADFMATIWQNQGDKEANRLIVTPIKNRIGGTVGTDLEFFINYNTLRLSDYKHENIATDEDDISNNILHSIEGVQGI